MKTIVGLYDDLADARQAVSELVDLGIDRDRISLVASDQEGRYSSALNSDDDVASDLPRDEVAGDNVAGGAATGAVVGGLGGLLLGLGALAIPGIGPAIAAGPLVSAVVGAGVGAAVGGLVGALINAGVPEEQAGYYAEGVRRGGTLVTVEAPDEQVDEVVRAMERHDPINVDERASTWRQEGWTGFNGGEPQSNWQASPQDTSTITANTRSTAAQPTLRDTVRRKDVDVEQIGGSNGSNDYDRYNPAFRNHWQSNYANRGYTWEQYEPAYRYGYTLANDQRYQGWDWNAIEADARRNWSQQHQDSPWEKFKDAVRQGWQQVKHPVTG